MSGPRGNPEGEKLQDDRESAQRRGSPERRPSARGALVSARGVLVSARGVLVIDKPLRLTSHDVVARVRRALGTKRVGHAGTLDPMASGVLVVLAGEATKLAPFLTAHDKRYEATVTLGASTDTLDAEGAITSEGGVPAELREQIERALAIVGEGGTDAESRLAAEAPLLHRALEAERMRTEQTPPAYSAIKVAGQRSYDRARAGEAIDLEPREVRVASLRLVPRSPGAVSDVAYVGDVGARLSLSLELEVSKGYYVRSLARDLGAHLGVPSHLSALRRTRSGPFRIADAVPLSAGPDALRAALIPLEQAAQKSLPAARLTEAGAARARDGKVLSPSDFSEPPPDTGELSAWLNPAGELVAVGLAEGSRLVIRRGFATNEADPHDP